MCSVRLTISTHDRREVEHQLKTARRLGQWRQVQPWLAILAVMDGPSVAAVAVVLHVHEQTVAAWVHVFCCDGLKGAPRQKPTGRPPKRTPTPQEAVAKLMDAAPVQAGFRGACGRAPMIQPMIDERFGVFSSVFSSAQWRRHLGVSSQKAACVSAQLDVGKRHAWCTTTWPQILRLAKARKALLLCGDAASFPQWGTRTYTWARRGQPPQVKTSGQRKGDKVFGLMADFTGRLLYHGHEGRLNSATSRALLTRLLEHTTQPIVLMQDGAKDHPSAASQAFFAQQTTRLQVFQLPTYSPDDHPSEKLWKKITPQDTHVPSFPTFEALTARVEQALFTCAHAPEEGLARCGLPTELAEVA